MSTTTVHMYCQAASGTSQGPGNATKVVQLVAIPAIPARGEDPAVPSPNAAIFIPPSATMIGNAKFDLVGLTREAFAGFEEGKTYTITIEEDAS